MDTFPPNKLYSVTKGGRPCYGKPSHYELFVGDRSYHSFKDRMVLLAKEDYNIVLIPKKQDAKIMNVWNLVWHALKPFPLRLKEVSKRPL